MTKIDPKTLRPDPRFLPERRLVRRTATDQAAPGCNSLLTAAQVLWVARHR